MIQFIVDHWEVLCVLLLSMPLLGISAGGGASNTDTRFERSGTSTSQQSHVVPSGLAGLLNQLANASSVPASTTTSQYSALNALLNRPTTDVPHKSVLDDNAKASPGTFTGAQVLESLASRDPNSSSFEADTTDAYQRRAGEAMAGLQSGPAAVRGATERVPLAQGQMATSLAEGRGAEVRGARVQEAGISTGAAQTSSAIEQARRQQTVLAQNQLFQQMQAIWGGKMGAAGGVDSARGSASGAIGQATNWLSGGQSSTSDNLKGKGSQGSSHFGGEVGTNCCFIFLQGLNGILPWYIDLARRDYYTPTRQRGYKWMSRWLVPKMRGNDKWQWAVNKMLIKPFLSYGSWLYGAGSKTGWIWACYCETWLATWAMIGKVVR